MQLYKGCKINLSLQETKRPSKEMQVSIARQLSLQPTTVGNFFMNARRRLQDKWKEGDYDQEGYDEDIIGNSEAEEGATQNDVYSGENQITINQELLVPELLQQQLSIPSQPSENPHVSLDMTSINQPQDVHSSHSEPHIAICNIIPVTQVTDITNSSLADQIVPVNTHQEQQISQIQKDALSATIGSDTLNCLNVPEATTAISDRINALNPNPNHSVYSLTSL